MNPFNIPLKDALATIAQSLLPMHSGQEKILEISVRMNYDKGGFQHVKIVFWRPGYYMLVAYSNDTHLDDIPDNFIITANHGSTWKHDGLNFFKDILQEPKEINILSCKVIEIENPIVMNSESVFSFRRKNVVKEEA